MLSTFHKIFYAQIFIQLTLSIVPLPATIDVSHENMFKIDFNNLKFTLTNPAPCEILDLAFKRYTSTIGQTKLKCPNHDNQTIAKETIKNVNVNLLGNCEDIPYKDMDETYIIEIDIYSFSISSNTVWGILRGLESLSQLFCRSEDGNFFVPFTSIIDYPRFHHRGLLLDTSRHYLSVESILNALDGMSFSKLNVFHWHIVDDQSFPYKSKVHPLLSEKGAYSSKYVYSAENISKIVKYAAQRGIRVIPEFDMPGHSKSWGAGYPELLAKCGDFRELINPIKEKSYDFMKSLFLELSGLFTDDHFHVGGDEVNFHCWKNDKEITAYMKKHNITSFNQLESYFIKRIELIQSTKTIISWEELFSNGVELRNNSIVQVWKGDGKTVLSVATKAGYSTLLSAGFYLDVVGLDWVHPYLVEPTDFDGTEEQKSLVIGGEACLWGEHVDDSNVGMRLFPIASLISERLWSKKEIRDLEDATKRAEELKCRLNSRGIAAIPVTGPSFCDYYN